MKEGVTMNHGLPAVPFSVDYGDGLKFDGDAAKAVVVDTEDLLNEAATNSGKIVFWGAMAAQSAFAVAAAKQELKTVRANRGRSIVEGMANELRTNPAAVKPTEANVANRLEGDAAVIAAEAQYARLVADSDTCKAIYEAIKQRKDMILMLNRIITADGSDDVRDYSPSASPRPRRRVG